MDILMTKGSVGDDVERLRRALAAALGGDAAMFPSLQKADAPIDQQAVSRHQAGQHRALPALRRSRARHCALTDRPIKDARIQVALDAGGKQPVLHPVAHGSFDNDIDVVSPTLKRITAAELVVPVDDLRGF